MKKIILTGGGTAGHVTPNLALLPLLKAEGFEVHYIGSKTGMEKELVEAEGIPYHGISAGKLRRYLDIKNVTDIFRVIRGFGNAFSIIRQLKPDIIFSKGGFVTVPVLAAGRMLRVKTVSHESDLTPGLANRISGPFTNKICVSFPETLAHLPAHKGVLTGSPIRKELLQGDKKKGLEICQWSDGGKPVIMVTGGSLGAAAINNAIREILPRLLARYRVVHLCGKGNLSDTELPGYAQFEYVKEGLADLYALADIAVSRAGANTLFEFLAMKKPNLLIPLPIESSRGDQILNAESFALQGFSKILPEGKITDERLLNAIDVLYNERELYSANMVTHEQNDGAARVMAVLKDTINNIL
ncbi:MAG: undecaprenyldiphospho-muramoylpentapeptide beta-N-acetylglucosaminyltransferase [Defluviitaleaceae bacterium]|nr:undecaprenyldiphospho-muramoylpentapeptide beta-N-acetylglucosaminyltransferase [Defluviitaleaceae bacterium]